MNASTTALDALARRGLSGLLGITITDRDQATGQLTARWDLNPNVLDIRGNVHDGAISSVIETLASLAAGAELAAGEDIVGVSNSTDFFHPTDRSPLTATAAVVDRNTIHQLWDVSIVDSDDVLVARGTVRLQQVAAR